MIETIGCFVAFLLLCFSWRNWKITARDAVRDRIIGLRDGWRRFYIENGYDMDDGAYVEVRNLLNGMLRYTKRMRMIGYMYFSIMVDEEIVARNSRAFDTAIGKSNEAIQARAKLVRRKAAEAIMIYMALTSLGFISGVVGMAIYMFPSKAIKWLRSWLRSMFDFKADTLGCAALYQA